MSSYFFRFVWVWSWCWLIWVMWWMDWERKGMSINICFLCLVQYGTTGKCPSFCCKDFFVSFSNCRLMLMSIFRCTFQSIPCQSNDMKHTRQCSESDQSQKVLGLLCAELCGGALSNVARRRNVTDSNVTVLVLEWDSDSHSSDDEDISAQSDSDTDNDIYDNDTNFTHWTDNTNCWPHVLVVHRLTWDPSGLRQRVTPHQ